jgi:hypothetical protein
VPDKAGSASGSRVASSLEEAEGAPRKELHAFRAEEACSMPATPMMDLPPLPPSGDRMIAVPEVKSVILGKVQAIAENGAAGKLVHNAPAGCAKIF